jgi:hypothetical protein
MAELGGGGFNEKMIFQLLKTHRKAAHMKGADVTTVDNGYLEQWSTTVLPNKDSSLAKQN